jgi:hypothetical protein
MKNYHKRKAIKKINRVMSNRACQFFLFGNANCRESFRYRLNQFAGPNSIDIDDWFSKEQKFNLNSKV